MSFAIEIKGYRIKGGLEGQCPLLAAGKRIGTSTREGPEGGHLRKPLGVSLRV